jgi:hypothetical protein
MTYAVPKVRYISLLITMAAGRQLSITKTFVTENKCSAPELLVTKFSESFGTVYIYTVPKDSEDGRMGIN